MNKTGFTLIEVMIVAGIMFVGILSTWQLFIYSTRMTYQARETTVAVNNARDILEEMQTLPFPIAPGYVINATLLNGTMPAAANETISVSYPNGIVNPLNITVVVNWTGADRRAHNVTFRTMRTRGI
jgi:prepilin-type N-terminal cleavage/methylation domain-containing protein